MVGPALVQWEADNICVIFQEPLVMHPMLNIATRAARGAGAVVSRSLARSGSLDIVTKARNDFVSEVDRAAEREIIATLRKAYPDHAILAEESGAQGDSEYLWVIDPLDGTTNFLHGLPQFAISIALKHRGRLEVAVIYDPMRDELFTAERGGGAQRDGKRLRVSGRKGLDGALIGTGFPFKAEEHLDAYLATFRALFPLVADVRRAGSAALDLAWVACGRLDGFWEIGLSEWDTAAGALLIREAGGLVSDFSGGEEYLQSGNVVAGSPKVFEGILRTITPHLTPPLKK